MLIARLGTVLLGVSTLVADLMRSGQASECRERHVGHQPQEYAPTDVAIGAKTPQAVVAVGNVESRHLPGQLQRHQGHREIEYEVGMRHRPCQRPKSRRRSIKAADPVLRFVTEA